MALFTQRNRYPAELARLPLFAGSSPAELRRAAAQMTKLRLPAGRVLIQEGGRGEELMFLVEGSAKVTRQSADGRDEFLATVGAGDVVGEMAVLADRRRGRRNATVTAVTDVVVYVCTPSEFRHVMEVAPSVADRVRQVAETRAEVPAAA